MVGRSIIEFIKTHKVYSILNIIIILASIFSALIPPKILEILVNRGFSSQKMLLIIAFVYTLSYILVFALALLKNILIYHYSQSFLLSLRKKMANHLMCLSYDAISKNEPGKIESYLNSDVNALNDLLTTGIIEMATNILKMIGILISIFLYSYILGLVSLIIIPIIFVFVLMVKKGMMRALLKGKKANAISNEILLENVFNIEQLKINKGLGYAKKRFERAIDNNYLQKQKINFYDAFFAPMMELIKYSIIVAFVLLTGINGSALGLNAGMLAASISLITDLFTPLEAITQEISVIADSATSVSRINNFFSLDTSNKGNLIPDDYNLKIKDMSFSYEGKKVFESFSLDIPFKSHILLRGVSGAGKSTLIKLIMGLLEPSDGEVLIGNKSVALVDDNSRQGLFAVFYQEPFFSGGTIYEEISLLNKNISPAKIEEALKSVGLGYIDDLNQVLKPELYSTGELALFNLARVIAHEAKIIIIDELGAKLDPITIDKIKVVLNQVGINKTIISISHHKDIISNAKEVFITALKN